MDGVWRLVAGPAAEPISLDEAKLQVRVDADAETGLIAAYIAAARQMCEEQTWRALMTQTWELLLPAWPDLRSLHLPRPPLQAVTWVRYVDADGTEQTLDTGAYEVITAREPGGLVLNYGRNWPQLGHAALPVTVRFVAGYGLTAVAVPEPLRQGMRLLVGHMYANRESVNVGNTSIMPQAVDWLWRPYQVRW